MRKKINSKLLKKHSKYKKKHSKSLFASKKLFNLIKIQDAP